MTSNNTITSLNGTLNSSQVSLPTAGNSGSGSGPDTATMFRGLVIVVGVVGATANGFVLVALLSKGLRQKNTNILIVNQVSIDFFSCLMVVLTSLIKLPLPVYRGEWGDVVCALFGSEMLIWMGLTSSIAGLVCITLERYWKIIHPIGHRKFFRKWMLYVLMVLTWISGLFMNLCGAFTSKVVGGRCIPYEFWANSAYQSAYTFVDLFWTFLVPLFIFVACYGHILHRLRGMIRVHDGDERTKTVADRAKAASSRRGQANIIKTLIMIAVVFFLCWCPNAVYNFMANITKNLTFNENIYYWSVLVVYLNVCANPFIYATKHDGVKNRLRGMVGMKAATRATVGEELSATGKSTKASQF